MKKLFFLFIIFVISGITTAQEYPLVSLEQINKVHDSTWRYFPQSPLAGDTVRVRGMVMVHPILKPIGDRRPLIWVSRAWACYIEDSLKPDWGGLNIYQADSNITGTLFDIVDTGSVYEFTGVVTPYFQSTELVLLTAPTPVQVNWISDKGKRIAPVPLLIDSFYTVSGDTNYALRRYQGCYVQINSDASHPLIVSDRVTGTGSSSGNFKLNDLNGRAIWNYAQSTYFKSNATGVVPGYQPPENGAYISFLRGILTIRNTGYYIVPCYPGDIGPVLITPPTVSSVKRTPTVVGPTNQVTITAVGKGVSAPMSAVKLFYRINNGNLDSLVMTKGIADTTLYTVTLPALNQDSAFVDYYVKATDANNLSSTSPANISNSRYSFFVLNKPLQIQHVRYSPFGSGYSSYNGYSVTVTGVVIADTSDIPGNHSSNPPRVYIQNGTTPWAGIRIGTAGANSNNILKLKRGYKVSVTGTITMGSTSVGVMIDTVTTLTILDSNQAMPAAKELTTGTIGTSTLGNVNAIQWDGMLVKYSNLKVDSTNADGTSNFGECYMNDGSTHTRIIWSDGHTTYTNTQTAGFTYVKKGDKFTSITGVLGFTHAQYKLCPRTNADVVGYVDEVNEISNQVPAGFALNQNYPNPFNPSTEITYAIQKPGMVQLKVYNILGQEVANLVSRYQNAGTYSVSFNAASLPTGVYVYSLTSNGMAQTKKMMLVK